MSALVDESRAKKQRVELMLDQKRLAKRIVEMGQEISADYADRTPLFLGVLKGCFVFMADLIRAVDLPTEVDFISAASYRNGPKADAELTVGLTPSRPIKGRDVLIVEGIVDSGRTISKLIEQFKGMEPASVAVVTLLDKPAARRVPVEIKYKGFTVGNEFVIGFGLDNAQKYRNLPFIGRLVDE